MNRTITFLVATILMGCGANHEGDAVEVRRGDSVVHESARVAMLSLATEQADQNSVSLVVNYSGRGNVQQGPRVAELVIQHSENLSFDSSEPGAAAISARKQVVVQARDVTHTRVVVYSGENTNGLGDGTVARLRFKRSGGGSATAQILTDRPIFAPKEAQQGLQVSEPLSM